MGITFIFCLDLTWQGSRQDRSRLEHLSVLSVSQHSEVAWQWSSLRQYARYFEGFDEVGLQNQGAGPSQSPVFGLQNTPSHLKSNHFFESCKKWRNACHLRPEIKTVFFFCNYLAIQSQSAQHWLLVPRLQNFRSVIVQSFSASGSQDFKPDVTTQTPPWHTWPDKYFKRF